MNLRCFFDWHDLSDPDWRWVSLDTWYWFRPCKRCGHRRKLENYVRRPPSHWELNEFGVYREVLNAPTATAENS